MPGKEKEFEALENKLARLTHQSEPGAVVYDFLKDLREPGKYLIYSRFRDADALQAHWNAAYLDEAIPLIRNCLSEKMQIQALELIW